MEVIEFKAKIRDGIIMVPEKYRNRVGNTVKVLVMSETTRNHEDMIDKLLEDPIKVEDFVPFARNEIYDR
ncbi:hypothetical protein DO021_20525 [Desulfobacter hydrogenophilus]|uniref:Uncharacterized protein n=1 Tax=Desulfobacter hydrogenophilus TaxID=2291 RepID=A0A328F926_9BACT|nr:hypothetical protein [Desulfobacter hydrogenophilus]NDY74276.1 hypothetical protein [Desulfobacter hydrogenophilus]QBH15083.1 hypothetical protein EYB58_20450 [Desulfobacter hydrogenophilus]RAM00150.1 hypothetical protein DO021_20525 [Desulfobacter hydrogenophilus]